MRKLLPHIILVFFAIWFFQRGVAPKKGEAVEWHKFSQLPIKYEGRMKPIDTFARNTLSILAGKQSIRTESKKRISATQWFLETISNRAEAKDYRIFRIENTDLLSTLHLKQRGGFRYSYRELVPHLQRLEMLAQLVNAKSKNERDLYDEQTLKLAVKIYRYENMLHSFEDASGISEERIMQTSQRFMQVELGTLPLVIPPSSEDSSWRPLMSVLLENNPAMQRVSGRSTPPNQIAVDWGMMLQAFRSNNTNAFNEVLNDYYRQLAVEHPDWIKKTSYEVYYNRLDAFMKSAICYLLVFLLSCFGWLARKKTLIRLGLTLMVCAFIPHTLAIIARSFLSGYPPVTNLYSSAIFIGWAAVLAGILLERFYKKADGMGNLAGSIAGFSTLLIAHFLAGDGDTMEQMRAVLDTRFWLTTHVITISLGYMAVLLAGFLGIFYILSGVFTRRLDEETRVAMDRMIYGTTCFSLLFSFIGTVLGGLWADDSWGRFWGWDPKENGALLIVLWGAIMLHARYGKLVKSRGFALMAVGGNIVVAWSWFGVNQLGMGLHSYGFTESATKWVSLLIFSQLFLILVGSLPSRLWKSARDPSS